MPYDTNRYFPTPPTRHAQSPPTRPTIPHQRWGSIKSGSWWLPRSPAPPKPYPCPRERPQGTFPTTVEKYERYEEVAGLAGTAAAFIEIGTFSGTPDAIDLLATGGDALVSLRDPTGREESALRLVANVPRETHISRRKVYAANVADGSPATVRATGKWAEFLNGDTE